ncbi:sensor histidine kinase, partial [Eisenbergiella porci]
IPLEDMTNALRNIQEGVWEVEFTASNRITEIENVRQTVRLMLKEIEQYKIRSYEEQLEKQKVQLQFLQLQLAPHFYTNCLKNAYYMLMMKEYENAEEFLLCLSAHLRYLLQTDAKLVTVKTEKEFVQNYVNMEAILSSRPFICEMSVDDRALDVEIPILTLQLFVENSIKYARGIEG